MSNGSTRAWLRPFLQPIKPVFREVLAMSAFVNLLALGVPVFTLQVYDRVIGHAGVSTLFGLVFGMIFVVVFDYILRNSRSRITQRVALRIDILVGRKLFDKLMELPLFVLESKPASFWQSLFRDVDTVRNTLSGASAILVCDLPFAVMFLALIVVIAAPVAWVLAIIIPLFMFIAWRSAAAMSAANQEEGQSSQTRDALIAEIINGRTTVKALALDNAMRPMWEERHADNIENSITRGTKADFYSNFGGSLTMGTTILMTTVGSVAIINGDLTMGSLVATNMLIGRLIGPLNQLVGQWRSFNSFKQSVDRLGEVFAIASERVESEVKLERPNGEITVDNVTFHYDEDLAPVLENISITIKARGVHALVGRNGSGKTTLMKIIQGLYPPTTGRVLLDGADMTQFSRPELAQWIGYVPQDCILFTGTVRDNIVHRHPNSPDEDIVKAATLAGVHHFIIDLPDGYATDIGEAGRRLSGGQRQRIAVARALLGDPPVVLLDEPSSSLDRQAETALRQTLIEIGKDRTVIIVTHSPILLAACDDLVALDKGKVALAGPSKEILPRLFGQQPQGPGGGQPKPNQPSRGGAPAGPKAPADPAAPATAPVAAAPPPPAATGAAPRGAGPAPRPPSAGPKPPPGPPPPPRGGAPMKRAAPPPPAASRPPPARPAPPKPAEPPSGPAAAPPPAASPPAPTPPAPPASQQKPAAKSAPPPSVAPEAPAKPTADPSVPSGNMFNLEGAAKELVDDPYADLINSNLDQRPPGIGANGEPDRRQ